MKIKWAAVAAVLALLGGALVWLATRPPAYALVSVDPATNICAGTNVDSLVLHGDVTRGVARTWANSQATVYWPPGYVARFDPELVVLDARGVVRAIEGDEMLASRPWHGLNVCFQSGGIVDVWEAGPWPT